MKKSNTQKAKKLFKALKIAGIIAMVLILLFTFLFALSPILLRFDFADKLFSNILIPLKSSDYKSSYVETLGALSGTFLGTFLAVLGAIYTQKKFDNDSKRKETKESATIVYYDFSFAIDETKSNYINAMIMQCSSKEGAPYEWYTKLQKAYNVRIDKEWIHNVAKLCHVLKTTDIKLIYSIYGDLESLIDSLRKPLEGEEIHIVFSAFMLKYFKLDSSSGKFMLKKEYSDILNKLKELSNISNNDSFFVE